MARSSVAQLALLVVGLIASACTLATASPTLDASTAPATPSVAEVRNGPIVLTLTAEGNPQAGVPISLLAVLVYEGPVERTAFRPGSGPIQFSLRQVGGTIHMDAGGPAGCESAPMRPGERHETPFIKSGAYTPSDPNAPFYRQFFSEKALILPAGDWEIAAIAAVSFENCGDVSTDPARASVTVTVRP